MGSDIESGALRQKRAAVSAPVLATLRQRRPVTTR